MIPYKQRHRRDTTFQSKVVQLEGTKVLTAEPKETFKNFFLSALLHSHTDYHNTGLLEGEKGMVRGWSVSETSPQSAWGRVRLALAPLQSSSMSGAARHNKSGHVNANQRGTVQRSLSKAKSASGKAPSVSGPLVSQQKKASPDKKIAIFKRKQQRILHQDR